jgi:hypothetical protein
VHPRIVEQPLQDLAGAVGDQLPVDGERRALGRLEPEDVIAAAREPPRSALPAEERRARIVVETPPDRDEARDEHAGDDQGGDDVARAGYGHGRSFRLRKV